MPVVRALRWLLARAGYVVHRWPNNRFDGTVDSLELLRRAGYRPRVVIDCGANAGQWARLATEVFPESEYHLIEPQAGCWPALERLARERKGIHVHRTVVSEPGVRQVRMIGGRGAGGTGNYVARPDEQSDDEVESPAATLDALFADRVLPDARAFLKLDIEGHEVAALRGAPRLLEAIEVVLTEVTFFDVHRSGLPLFEDVDALLRAKGFALYDFACLAKRPSDGRLRMGDVLYVRRSSPLVADVSWG